MRKAAGLFIVLIFLPGLVVFGGKKQDRQLLKAIKTGNAELVLDLLEAGANPNAKAGGEPYLMCALEYGHMDMVRAMIEKGGQTEIVTKAGNILHKAASRGRMDALEAMLNLGVDPNVKDSLRRTPLIISTMNGDFAIVKALLDRGAAVNFQDKYKKTALHYAVLAGHINMVELLLQRGANIGLEDQLGNTPLQYIGFLKHRGMLDLLIIHGKVNVPGHQTDGSPVPRRKDSPWLFASHGKTDLLGLRYASRLDQANISGVTPLMAAIQKGRVETARFLLDQGARPNARNKDGHTPLGMAVGLKDPAMVTLLLAHGANLIGYKDEKAIRASGNKDLKTLSNVMDDYDLIKFRPKRIYKDPIPYADEKDVKPPVFTKRVSPKYPREAAKVKINGYVLLEAILTAEGQIENIAILKNLDDWGYGFEYEAIKALKQWEFQPATLKEEPADVRMTLKIDFILR